MSNVCFLNYNPQETVKACDSINDKSSQEYSYCTQGAAEANYTLMSSNSRQYWTQSGAETICTPMRSNDPVKSFMEKGCKNYIIGSFNPCSSMNNLNPNK